MRLSGMRFVVAAWALGAVAGMNFAAAPASAQPAAAAFPGCPSIAPINAWARRNNYVAAANSGDVLCGDFTGDGAADAVAFLEADEEWSGNSMPPYAVILFRNVGGRLQHLRTVSTPDNMTIFGTGYEDARFERGRIVLTHQTLTASDSRCCPTGVTAFTINATTGRVAERLLRRMDEAEQQRLVDRSNAEAATATATAPAVASSGWRVERNERGGVYAIVRTGMSALPEMRLACGPNGSPVFAANLPNQAPNAHLNLTFATGPDTIAVLDTDWQRDPSGPTWVKMLRDPTVPNLLGGNASAADVRLNGRALGRLSLAGSTATLREALAACWQPAANRAGSAVTDAGFAVDIVLTPRAAADLARRREGITVWTSFSGTPRNENGNHVDDHSGELDLGEHEVTVAGQNIRVDIPGSALRRERFSNLRGTPQVLVNVYSARRSDQDNLLTCGIVHGELSQVAGRTHRITCALIDER